MYDFIFQDKDNFPWELKTLKVAFADAMEQYKLVVFLSVHVCFCECMRTCVCVVH